MAKKLKGIQLMIAEKLEEAGIKSPESKKEEDSDKK